MADIPPTVGGSQTATTSAVGGELRGRAGMGVGGTGAGQTSVAKGAAGVPATIVDRRGIVATLVRLEIDPTEIMVRPGSGTAGEARLVPVIPRPPSTAGEPSTAPPTEPDLPSRAAPGQPSAMSAPRQGFLARALDLLAPERSSVPGAATGPPSTVTAEPEVETARLVGTRDGQLVLRTPTALMVATGPPVELPPGAEVEVSWIGRPRAAPEADASLQAAIRMALPQRPAGRQPITEPDLATPAADPVEEEAVNRPPAARAEPQGTPAPRPGPGPPAQPLPSPLSAPDEAAPSSGTSRPPASSPTVGPTPSIPSTAAAAPMATSSPAPAANAAPTPAAPSAPTPPTTGAVPPRPPEAMGSAVPSTPAPLTTPSPVASPLQSPPVVASTSPPVQTVTAPDPRPAAPATAVAQPIAQVQSQASSAAQLTSFPTSTVAAVTVASTGAPASPVTAQITSPLQVAGPNQLTSPQVPTMPAAPMLGGQAALAAQQVSMPVMTPTGPHAASPPGTAEPLTTPTPTGSAPLPAPASASSTPPPMQPLPLAKAYASTGAAVLPPGAMPAGPRAMPAPPVSSSAAGPSVTAEVGTEMPGRVGPGTAGPAPPTQPYVAPAITGAAARLLMSAYGQPAMPSAAALPAAAPVPASPTPSVPAPTMPPEVGDLPSPARPEAQGVPTRTGATGPSGPAPAFLDEPVVSSPSSGETGARSSGARGTSGPTGAGPMAESRIGQPESTPLGVGLGRLMELLDGKVLPIDGEEEGQQRRRQEERPERLALELELSHLGPVRLELAWSPREISFRLIGRLPLDGQERAALLRDVQQAIEDCGVPGRLVVLDESGGH